MGDNEVLKIVLIEIDNGCLVEITSQGISRTTSFIEKQKALEFITNELKDHDNL